MFYSKFSKLSTCFSQRLDAGYSGKISLLFQLSGGRMAWNYNGDQPANQPTSASAGTLKKHYILHLILTELLQQNINVKCAKYNVCFFVFTFPLDCCLASQRPRWAIRTSCGGNTANGTQNTTIHNNFFSSKQNLQKGG